MPLDFRKNPFPEVFNQKHAEWDMLRGSIQGNNLYIWDGSFTNHEQASKKIEELNYKEQFPFYFDGDNLVISGIENTKWAKFDDDIDKLEEQLLDNPYLAKILRQGGFSIEGMPIEKSRHP